MLPGVARVICVYAFYPTALLAPENASARNVKFSSGEADRHPVAAARDRLQDRLRDGLQSRLRDGEPGPPVAPPAGPSGPGRLVQAATRSRPPPGLGRPGAASCRWPGIPDRHGSRLSRPAGLGRPDDLAGVPVRGGRVVIGSRCPRSAPPQGGQLDSGPSIFASRGMDTNKYSTTGGSWADHGAWRGQRGQSALRSWTDRMQRGPRMVIARPGRAAERLAQPGRWIACRITAGQRRCSKRIRSGHEA